MTARIRDASPEDAAALGRILSDWIDATPWMPRLHTRDEDYRFVAGPISRASVLTLDIGGRPEGFLARDGERIPAFYLAPERRGQGHGARLLDRAKRTSDRLRLWAFQSNKDAIRFYEREGFAESRRTDGENDEGMPDVELVWQRREGDPA